MATASEKKQAAASNAGVTNETEQPKKRGKYGKDAHADDEEEEEVRLSCSEKMSLCWTNFKYTAHHDNLYFNNTCANWRIILAIFLVIYTVVALAYWGFLELAERYPGGDVMYVYLCVFLAYVAFLTVLVTVGHFERKRYERRNPEISR